MTVCKVLLFGLKPCDISSSTNDKISETLLPRHHSLIPTTSAKLQPSSDTDYLNLDIKPLITPTNSVRQDNLIDYISNIFILAFFDKR